MRLVPRPGWQAWVVDEATLPRLGRQRLERRRPAGLLLRRGLPARARRRPDPARGLRPGGDRRGRRRGRFALPDVSTELAGLSGAQTFDGDKTFAGELEASGPVATIGTAPGTATYGVGTGATASGATKTVNLGTGGAAGSDTVVNIGSATPGADGATVVNTPTVTFANGVTVVGMPQANLTALLLGLGGAVADAWNRLSVNTPAVLLNNAGAGIEATVNKAAAGNDAAFAFKTGFSARALIGLLGSDDFSFKVSPDGSAYHDAILIDRTSGRVELPKPAILPAASSAPAAPASGKLALYARTRAGQPWLDAMRPNGRDFSLQPHLGLARTANWLPSSGATITTEGMSNSTVGTVSTPGLAATSLATSMRRWRLTSAATADSASDQRSGVFTCWRGNAAGLGGWTFVTRISLATLQATGMAFFGLYGSTAALATTLALERRRQLHRHRLPARHPHPLAARQQRRERRADADRHGRELRHRHRRRADALHRGGAERRLGLGAGGRRGERRGLRAGGHRRPAGCEPVPRAAALHEQRRDRGGRRLRLLGRLPRDRLLIRPVIVRSAHRSPSTTAPSAGRGLRST